MLISHISSPINFYSVPEDKYENCITREEYDRQLSEEDANDEYMPNASGSASMPTIRINPKRLLDTGNELFAGDMIIGYYSDGDTHSLCIYEWKRNNSRKINAYSPLLKVEAGEVVDDDIQLIGTQYRRLFGTENRRKILLTL